jgi:hypothetical protein
VIGVQAEGPKKWVQEPAGTREFSFPKRCPDQLWDPPYPCSVMWGFSPAVKHKGSAPYYILPTFALNKNAETLDTYLHFTFVACTKTAYMIMVSFLTNSLETLRIKQHWYA